MRWFFAAVDVCCDAAASALGGGGAAIILCKSLQHFEYVVDPLCVPIRHGSLRARSSPRRLRPCRT
jgi:hypothetical protein